MALLEVEDLRTEFAMPDGTAYAEIFGISCAGVLAALLATAFAQTRQAIGKPT